MAGDAFGLRLGRWKYIEAPREGRRELFDLERDPGETRDLGSDRAALRDDLSRRIARWRGEAGATAPTPMHLDASDRERLRAMGYAE